jgi:hypothetical protein
MKRAVLALVLAWGPPAHAQEDTAFANEVLNTAAACFAAPDGTTPEAMAGLCSTASDSLGRLILNKVDPTANETSTYRAMRAIVLSSLGAAQAQIDGVRSARSCRTMEDAWLSAAYIDPTTSPDHADDMAKIRADVAGMVRACRQEFDTPIAAPAVPPG